MLFGEATGILAGDALIALAFVTLSGAPAHLAQRAIQIVHLLAKTLGPEGMAGGQCLELEGSAASGDGESSPPQTMTPEHIERCHSMKTAALFQMAAEAGAITVGAAEP